MEGRGIFEGVKILEFGQIVAGPLIGEHNEYVYKNLAGFSQKEYEQLQKEGVFD
jgi:crotonobetainyl-CoA:carnitine CoA-transferase CaiB-like acyl-CoA transferase